MKTNYALTALAALAQESRLAIFRLLVQAGPEGLAAAKIAERLSIPPPSLSFHLKELAHAQMVIPVKNGRSIIYSANFETMNDLLGFLTENCCGGNPCSSVCTIDCSTAESSLPSEAQPASTV
jgi:ArsR family transcriptional regulator